MPEKIRRRSLVVMIRNKKVADVEFPMEIDLENPSNRKRIEKRVLSDPKVQKSLGVKIISKTIFVLPYFISFQTL